MLAVTLTIGHIDYESTIRHIFPVVIEKLPLKDSRSMLGRLFYQLGDAALPVLTGLLSRLSEDTKNELLVRALNAYAPVLKERLNEELQKDQWGQCFSFGTILVEKRDGILLNIGQISVNYHVLLNQEQVQGVIQKRFGRWGSLVKSVVDAGTVFAKNTTERIGLELLLKEENKERLLKLVRGALDKYGILIEVEEIQIMEEGDEQDTAEVTQPFTLTEKMEEDIIGALAGYLRDHVENGYGPREGASCQGPDKP